MKILHAPNNITGTPKKLAELEREKGFNSDSVSTTVVDIDGPSHFVSRDNLFAKIFFRIKYFYLSLTYYDVLNFHAGSSLLPLNLDLPFYRFFNKRVIFHYYGSEVRLTSELKKINPYYKLLSQDNKNSENKDWLKKLKMYWASIWVDHAIAPKDVYFYVSKVFKEENISKIWSANLLSSEYLTKIDNIVEQKTLPVIIHCPTNKATKGTEFVLGAIERLKNKGIKFQFFLIENKEKEFVQDFIINEADIVLDQYLTGSFGNLCVETMAAGKVAHCYLNDNFHDNDNLPIVNTTIENIEESLESLILNHEKRKEISLASQNFIKEKLNNSKVFQELEKIYTGK